MANNKVILGDEVIMDITDTTAEVESVSEGRVFYGADGKRYEGSMVVLLPQLIVNTKALRVWISKDSKDILATKTAEDTWECKIPSFGTWSVSATFKEEVISTELVVDTVKIYTVSLSRGMDYTAWLQAGGITKSFASLEEVLADEPTVRQLMTKHASVDYLVSNCDSASAETIFNTFNVMKWVNLRDYALDKLSEVAEIKATMDEVGMYGYGEVTMANAVPTMTSNISPYAGAIGDKINTSFPAWKAFDGERSSSSKVFFTTNVDVWVGFCFQSPITASSAMFVSDCEYGTRNPKTFKFQGSKTESGDDWVDLTEVLSNTDTSINKEFSYKFTKNVDSYLRYRVYILTNNGGAQASICELQFLAPTLKGCVPVMTANNAPYGEAFGSSQYDSDNYTYFKAFDGDDTGRWAGTNGQASYTLGYKFSNPTCVRKVKVRSFNDNSYQLKASNDGTTWESVGESFTASTNTDKIVNVNNDKFYLQYRLDFAGVGGVGSVYTLQFYGRELKVSVPKMTSYTEPWGEASASELFDPSSPSTFPPYYAFRSVNNTESEVWHSKTNGGIHWLMYDFKRPVIVKFFHCGKRKNFASRWWNNAELQASNDNSSWETLLTGIKYDGTTNAQFYTINNNKEFRYYRIYDPNITNYLNIAYTNFYGPDYSEHEERTYIYDHGVELSELEVYNDANGLSAKESDSLYISKKGTANTLSRINTISKIDLTSKKLLRVVADKKWSISNGGTFRIACTNAKSTLSTYQGTASLDLYGNSDLPNNINLNISSVNESDYIEFQALNISGTYTGHYSIAEAWVE